MQCWESYFEKESIFERVEALLVFIVVNFEQAVSDLCSWAASPFCRARFSCLEVSSLWMVIKNRAESRSVPNPKNQFWQLPKNSLIDSQRNFYI